MAAVRGSTCTRAPTGEGRQMSGFRLTDAAIERALAPGLDVAAPSEFAGQIAAAIATEPRRTRWWSALMPAAWPRLAPLTTQLILLAILLVALVVGALAVASLTHRGLANGHLIISDGAELVDVDPETGTSRTLLTASGTIFGVTRSDDGSLISFWTETRGAPLLEIVGANGTNRRRMAADLVPAPIGQGQIDVWSPGRLSLASGVQVAGQQRILVVDVSSGRGAFVGPTGATNPLWSPDGQWIAFSYWRDGRSVLAVMHPDGSGFDEVSGDLGAFDVSGANNWSPDSAWVYYGADRNSFSESRIYRARIQAHNSEQLTPAGQFALAPALSPDGRLVVYGLLDGPIDRSADLYVMDADGFNPHFLIESARNLGWSNDGQYVLAEWRPANAAYELLILRPDGSGKRTLMTFEGGCVSACVQDLGWGQPRP